MGTKIGIGIVTYERPEYFRQCIGSLPDGVGTIVVVNDGRPYDDSIYPSSVKHVIQHTENKSVGVSKNEALRYLLQDGCDYLFLIEDDMEVLRHDVFEKYIRTAEVSGLWHMNYGPGTPINRRQLKSADAHDRDKAIKDSPPNPRLIVQYDGDTQVALYLHLAGMFSFFGRSVIEQVGLHDEAYYNAWEHVDHTYRVIKVGRHPPFWWFADVWDSTKYLREIEGNIENSSITKDTEKWKVNIEQGAEHYRQVHGHYPNQIRNASDLEVKSTLRMIMTAYAGRG